MIGAKGMRHPKAAAFALLVLSSLVLLGFSARSRPKSVATPSLRALGALTPQISPQGDTVAFSYQGAIWRLPREGGVMRRLTSSAGWDMYPTWSADGKQIAYTN